MPPWDEDEVDEHRDDENGDGENGDGLGGDTDGDGDDGVRDDFAAFLQTLDASVGDLPEKPSEELLEMLTPETLQKLGPDARGVIRHLAARARQGVEAATANSTTKAQTLDEREAALNAREEALDERHNGIMKVFHPDRIKQLLGADDGKELDPYTKEGMVATWKREIGGQLREVVAPLEAEADALARRRTYSETVKKYPEMQQADFKDEVKAEIQRRGKAAVEAALSHKPDLSDEEKAALYGQAIAGKLEDAINTVAAARSRKSREDERARRRAAHQRSNAHISRTTTPNVKRAPDLKAEGRKLAAMSPGEQLAYLNARPELKKLMSQA